MTCGGIESPRQIGCHSLRASEWYRAVSSETDARIQCDRSFRHGCQENREEIDEGQDRREEDGQEKEVAPFRPAVRSRSDPCHNSDQAEQLAQPVCISKLDAPLDEVSRAYAMNLLLDTHVVPWFFRDDARLSQNAKSFIEESANRKLVSIASCWEIAIKARLGRLRLTEPSGVLLTREISRNYFELLSIELSHATAVEALPMHHRDPFAHCASHFGKHPHRQRRFAVRPIGRAAALVDAASVFQAHGTVCAPKEQGSLVSIAGW